MRLDRVFFAPGALAIGKSIAYFLAFCTALLVVEPTSQTYYFGVIIYCCGCICDYIECAMPTTGKCKSIRNASLGITIVTAFVVILTFSLLYSFNEQAAVVSCIANFKILVNLLFCTFWCLPLYSGLRLLITRGKKKSKLVSSGQKYSVGYYIMPRADD